MEKKARPTQLSYSDSVSLYRDDLEDIINILSDKCTRVTIEDNQYKYDSLDEVFNKRGTHPHQLSITGWEPFVSFKVKIKRNRTTLETSGDGDNLAPFYFVQNILKSRRRIRQLTGLIFPMLLLQIGAILVINKPPIERLPGLVKGSLFMALIIIQYALALIHGGGAFSIISLKRKHEYDSFWSRNKDKIWLLIIGTLVGLIAGNIGKIINLFSYP